MTSLTDKTADAVFDSPEHQAKLAQLYRDFDAEGMTPLWQTREGLMPFSPEPRAVPHLWRWARLYPLAAQRRPRAGRAGRRAPRHRAGQPRPARRSLRHADAVGRDPVPRPAGGRARAPAHPVRVPVRRRGRGRVDRRRRRPGGDAPRRLPAHAGLALPRAPERRPTSRWPGSTAWTSRSSPPRTRVLRVRPRRADATTATPDRSRSRAAVGRTPACARCRPRASPARPPR